MDAAFVEHRWRWRIGAALLIAVASALHVAYLILDCPLDLAPDEAHYWDWSRHLDWSYYSKGPLVALLIRGSCELFGPWAEAATGTVMPAIRFPAILCGALLLAGLYVLTALALKRELLAFGAVGLALTQPIVAAGSSLMTIDAPFTACWMWALVFTYLAAVNNREWAWLAAGLVIAIGILAKYTMVLFLPSLALFLLWRFGFQSIRNPQSAIRNPPWRGFILMCAIASLGAVPIAIWNAQHDWVTLRHLGGQAAGAQPTQIRWLGPFTFIGGQLAIMLGFWFVVWAAAMWHYRPRWSSECRPVDPESAIRNPQSAMFLWCMAAPTFVVFLLLSLKSSGQVNWPVAMYLSGGVLAAAWLSQRATRRVWRWGTVAAASIGFVAVLIVHFPAISRPVLVSIAGPPTLRYPLPIRRLDPTARLRGYRTLAAAVDRMREQARTADGREPVVVATFWNMPGELGVYCAGHPQVYSLGPALYDRRSQIDFWRPNPLWDPDEFRGRTFIIVGDFTPGLMASFDRVDFPTEVCHTESGEPVALWHIAIGWGYRGFGSIDRLKFNKNF